MEEKNLERFALTFISNKKKGGGDTNKLHSILEALIKSKLLLALQRRTSRILQIDPKSQDISFSNNDRKQHIPLKRNR